MTQEQLPVASRDQVTVANDADDHAASSSMPASPVPLAVVRTHAPPGETHERTGPLGRLRRSLAGPGGSIIRRNGGGGTGTVTAPPDPSTLMPQSGKTYDLPTAIAELQKYHPSKKDATKFSNNGRKSIAKAWGDYILANHLSQLKPGSVRDTYKSSYDQGDPDEFSVSQEITGLPDVVIHAHMDKTGKAKPGNGVHWKWQDKEKLPESFEMTSGQVGVLLDQGKAKTSWTSKVTLPTVGGTGTTTAPTTAPPTTTTPPVTSTVTPSLPTK